MERHGVVLVSVRSVSELCALCGEKTIFRSPLKNKYRFKARITERQFRAILRLFCAEVCALTAAGLVGVNKNTAPAVDGRLRPPIVELTFKESRPCTGEVEADESHFGARRVRGRKGSGAAGKIPVFGLLKRGGKV
jgi:transposase